MAEAAAKLVAAPVARIPRLGAVPRWRLALWLGALTALVSVMAAAYLAYSGSVATTSYAIQRLETERDLWKQRNEQLQLELDKVRSLTWVEHEAVTRLKMQKAPPSIYLGADGSVARVPSPTPAPASPR